MNANTSDSQIVGRMIAALDHDHFCNETQHILSRTVVVLMVALDVGWQNVSASMVGCPLEYPNEIKSLLF